MPSLSNTRELHAAFGPLADEWIDLADRLHASPFVRPGWIAPWIEAFGRGRLELLTVRRGGRLAGVLPLLVRHGVACSPTNFHTPHFDLLAEDEDVAAELVGKLLARPGVRRTDLAFLMPESHVRGPLRDALEDTGRPTIARVIQRSPYLRIDGDWESYQQRLKPKFRRELTRRRRRLGELGTVAVHFHDGSERREELLERTFRVEAAGWKGRGGTAIASQRDTRLFYGRVAQWAADRGWLRLGFLELDGRPVAVNMMVDAGGTRYGLKTGFLPELARYGIGNELIFQLLRDAHERGVRLLEMLGDDDPYKRVWGVEVRPLLRVQAFSRSAAGRASHLAWGRGRPAMKAALGVLSSGRA